MGASWAPDDPRLRPPDLRRSPAERVEELRDEPLRHLLAQEAEPLRPPVRGQVEGAEQEIEEREEPGEVLVEPFLLRRVVPAVEGGARDHVAQGTEGPGQVRVDEDRPEG